MLNIWLPVNQKDLSVGTYRMTFNVNQPQLLPVFSEKKELSVLGKKISFDSGESDVQNKKYKLQITLFENPIPVVAIIAGFIVVAGLVAGSVLLDKVEKLIDNPIVPIAIGAAGIFGLTWALKSVRK